MGCVLKGSQKPYKCFVLYPHLRCQGRGSDRQGYTHRDRSKSKRGERSKHRGSTPYPIDRRSAKRVADKQLGKHDDVETETDRDSDSTLDDLRDAVKDHNKYLREVERYQELANRDAEEAREKRKSLKSKQRRLRINSES